jgi:hypothetical protein
MILSDGVEHARRRREEQRQAEKEAFAGLVLESLDHPAVQERLRTRQQQDTDLADALLRVLKSALGKELRDRIKEIANA